jgi:hypothetical protein
MAPIGFDMHMHFDTTGLSLDISEDFILHVELSNSSRGLGFKLRTGPSVVEQAMRT